MYQTETYPLKRKTIIEKIPSPKDYSSSKNDAQALVFDFQYSNHSRDDRQLLPGQGNKIFCQGG